MAQPPSEAVAGAAYHGIPFQTIVDRWLELYGVPEQGDRHTSALRLACDLRYICDNDPRRLVGVLRLAAFVRDIIGERGEEGRCENLFHVVCVPVVEGRPSARR